MFYTKLPVGWVCGSTKIQDFHLITCSTSDIWQRVYWHLNLVDLRFVRFRSFLAITNEFLFIWVGGSSSLCLLLFSLLLSLFSPGNEIIGWSVIIFPFKQLMWSHVKQPDGTKPLPDIIVIYVYNLFDLTLYHLKQIQVLIWRHEIESYGKTFCGSLVIV